MNRNSPNIFLLQNMYLKMYNVTQKSKILKNYNNQKYNKYCFISTINDIRKIFKKNLIIF